MISDNLAVVEGRLTLAGRDLGDLAARYGSPLYVMDESTIRRHMRTYLDAMHAHFDGRATICYASKACAFMAMYRIAAEEGVRVDVVSMGEAYTAYKASFPMAQVYFHGNNKTDEEIARAMDWGIGCFVVDSAEELGVIDAEAARRGITQRVMLRITPGIDTHTYEAIATGQVDSKFGSAIETGQAASITGLALRLKHLQLAGFHCHVGSQVFDSDTFFRSADIMLAFMADMRAQYGYVAEELDLGGGYGVRYVESDPVIDIADNIRQVAAHVRAACAHYDLPLPAMRLEPGRSIVADAGVTLYTVGSVKRIPGYKTYVSVDGGMTDNPRYALYGAPYTVVAPTRMDEPCDMLCSVVGKCCESGDILQENVFLPSGIGRGDMLAVLTTGAYNYSMASNYNRVGRLPVIMLTDGGEYVAVRRESLDDLIRNDM